MLVKLNIGVISTTPACVTHMARFEANYPIPSFDDLLADSFFFDIASSMNLVEISLPVRRLAELGRHQEAITLLKHWVSQDGEAILSEYESRVQVVAMDGNRLIIHKN